MNLTDIDLVQRILTEYTKIQPSVVLSNIGFLSLAVGLRVVVGKFKLGKKLATAEISNTTSRVRPFLNSLIGPLAQGTVASLAALGGHTLLPLLLGVATIVDLLFVWSRVRDYQTKVLVFEKGLFHCGDFLEYKSSQECYIQSTELYYKKGSRKVIAKLCSKLKERLTGTEGIVDMTGIVRSREPRREGSKLDLH